MSRGLSRWSVATFLLLATCSHDSEDDGDDPSGTGGQADAGEAGAPSGRGGATSGGGTSSSRGGSSGRGGSSSGSTTGGAAGEGGEGGESSGGAGAGAGGESGEAGTSSGGTAGFAGASVAGAGGAGMGGSTAGSGGNGAGTGGSAAGAGGNHAGMGGAGMGGSDAGAGGLAGAGMGGIAAGMGGLSGAGGFAGAGGLAGAGGSGPLSGYDLQMNYLAGVTGATDIAFHTDGRAVVTEKSGTIVVRRVNGSRVTQNGAFAGIDTSTEKGLLGVVADPNVATNHRFYFYATYDSSAGDIGRVMRGTLGANDAFTIDSVPIVDGLSADQVQIGGGMWIAGTQLFVGVGDGGYNTSPPGNKRAQCLNLPNGKILRVNLDGSTPNDNPLVAVPMVTSCTTYDGAWSTAAPDARIYAWGLRNPWRFWIDPGTNLLWIGDVGNVSREEISIGGNGTNFGWPFREATTTWPALDGKDCSTGLVPSVGCTAPVYDYARGVGPSVTGGLIPSGCGWENVWPTKTYYVFGDWSADFIKALEVRPDRTGLVNSTPILLEQLDNTGPASFRMGADDSLYVVMNRANAVYRFTPKTRSGAGCP